ncbi:MAG: cytochrome P450 [Actinomycetota bacterium]
MHKLGTTPHPNDEGVVSMRREQVLIPLVRQIVKRPRLADAFFRLDRWGSPFTDEAVDDPMALAPAMRASGPVHWHPLYQQWFVSGYDEAREVLASPHVGTANQMEVLLDVRPYTSLSADSRSMLRHLMLLTDPPKHSRLRGLVNRAFTPRQVSRLEPMMTSMVDELLAGLLAGPDGDDADPDEIELMGGFAVPFPAMVISELFGLDRTNWRWLREVSATFAKLIDPVRGFDPDEVDAAVDEFRSRVLTLAAERRAVPADDLLTGLALAEADDGDRLSEDELVSVAGLILFAGHETTSSMIGLSVLLLRERPDQLDLLRRRPELWPNAIEELLRFDPTLRSDPRTVNEDFELAGHHLKRGQNIIVLTQLANRDLRRLPDADELLVDRDDPAPLSFGHGIHFCLGANLARGELLAALPPLLDALDGYEVDRSAVEWRESISLRGPVSFPLLARNRPG